jgi:hypothetical protein
MGHSQTRLPSFILIAALMSAVLASIPYRAIHVTFAADRPLSDAELKKIQGWIADNGNTVSVSKLATDILGLTANDEAISTRAFAVKESNSEIHQIGIIPEGKGYLEDHLHDDKLDVYWADKDLVLISALTGVRGGRPEAVSFREAQAEFSKELAWWAKFAGQN